MTDPAAEPLAPSPPRAVNRRRELTLPPLEALGPAQAELDRLAALVSDRHAASEGTIRPSAGPVEISLDSGNACCGRSFDSRRHGNREWPPIYRLLTTPGAKTSEPMLRSAKLPLIRPRSI